MTQNVQRKMQKRVNQLMLGGALLLLSCRLDAALSSMSPDDYKNLVDFGNAIGWMQPKNFPPTISQSLSDAPLLAYEKAFASAFSAALNKNIRPRLVTGIDTTVLWNATTTAGTAPGTIQRIISRMTSKTLPPPLSGPAKTMPSLPLNTFDGTTLTDAVTYFLNVIAPFATDTQTAWSTLPLQLNVQPLRRLTTPTTYRAPSSLAELVEAATSSAPPITKVSLVTSAMTGTALPPVNSLDSFVRQLIMLPAASPTSQVPVALPTVVATVPQFFDVIRYFLSVGLGMSNVGPNSEGSRVTVDGSSLEANSLLNYLDGLLGESGKSITLAPLWATTFLPSIAPASMVVSSIDMRIGALLTAFSTSYAGASLQSLTATSAKVSSVPLAAPIMIGLSLSAADQATLVASWQTMLPVVSLPSARSTNAVFRMLAFQANQTGVLSLDATTVTKLQALVQAFDLTVPGLPSASPVSSVAYIKSLMVVSTRGWMPVLVSGVGLAIKPVREKVTDYRLSSILSAQDTTPLGVAIDQQIARATLMSVPSEWGNYVNAVTPSVLGDAAQYVLSLMASGIDSMSTPLWNLLPSSIVVQPFASAPAYPFSLDEFFVAATTSNGESFVSRGEPVSPETTVSTGAGWVSPDSWNTLVNVGIALDGTPAGIIGSSQGLESKVRILLGKISSGATKFSPALDQILNYDNASMLPPFNAFERPINVETVSARITAIFQFLGEDTYTVGNSAALLGTDQSMTVGSAAALVWPKATNGSTIPLSQDAAYYAFIQKLPSQQSMVLIETMQPILNAGLQVLGAPTPSILNLINARGTVYANAVTAVNTAYTSAYQSSLLSLRSKITNYGTADSTKDTTPLLIAVQNQLPQWKSGYGDLTNRVGAFLNCIALIIEQETSASTVNVSTLLERPVTPEYVLGKSPFQAKTMSDIMTLIGAMASPGQLVETAFINSMIQLVQSILPMEVVISFGSATNAESSKLEDMKIGLDLVSLEEALSAMGLSMPALGSVSALIDALASYENVPSYAEDLLGNIPLSSASLSERLSAIATQAQHLAGADGMLLRTGSSIKKTVQSYVKLNQALPFPDALLAFFGDDHGVHLDYRNPSVVQSLIGAPLYLLQAAANNGVVFSLSSAGMETLNAVRSYLGLFSTEPLSDSKVGAEYAEDISSLNRALLEVQGGINTLISTVVPGQIGMDGTLTLDLQTAIAQEHNRVLLPVVSGSSQGDMGTWRDSAQDSTTWPLVQADVLQNLSTSLHLKDDIAKVLNLFSGIRKTDGSTTLSTIWHSYVAQGGFTVTVFARGANYRAPYNLNELVQSMGVQKTDGINIPGTYSLDTCYVGPSFSPIDISGLRGLSLMAAKVNAAGSRGTPEEAIVSIKAGLDAVASHLSSSPTGDLASQINALALWTFDPSPSAALSLKERLDRLFEAVFPVRTMLSSAHPSVSYGLDSWNDQQIKAILGITALQLSQRQDMSPLENSVYVRSQLMRESQFAGTDLTNLTSLAALLLGDKALNDANQVLPLVSSAALVLQTLGAEPGDWETAATMVGDAVKILQAVRNSSDSVSSVPNRLAGDIWAAAASDAANLSQIYRGFGVENSAHPVSDAADIISSLNVQLTMPADSTSGTSNTAGGVTPSTLSGSGMTLNPSNGVLEST